MRERLKGSYTWRVKKLVKVQTVLGTLINFMGMRRINTRGVKLANKGMITISKSNQTHGQYIVGFTADRNETTELTQNLPT